MLMREGCDLSGYRLYTYMSMLCFNVKVDVLFCNNEII